MRPSGTHAPPVSSSEHQVNPATSYLWPASAGWPAPALAEQPSALAYTYEIQLQTIHRAIDGEGSSSTFVFTNTAVVAADYYLDFYWPNGELHHIEGPYNLAVDESYTYDMATADFGVGTYAGYVVVGGEEPVDGRILTPDYGLISGIVYESDGSTPLQIDDVSVSRQSDDAYFGGIYVLSDGSFYIGGLPDDDFVVFAYASYPWASQWYSGRLSRDQADPVTISGAGETAIAFTMQPGGRITGTVYASDGTTPLENVNVDIEQGGHGTCTDADGNYVIQGLVYGDYKVVAGQGWNWCLNAESTWVTEYYQETQDPNVAIVLSLSDVQDTIQGIDFTLDVG
ncbi:MAG: hypothetical protein GWN58_43025, partial [Anaerolineae bacterium]|nr:hypothetical protein [Anaerolineae bacterium]